MNKDVTNYNVDAFQKKYEELKNQFHEMGQLKSDFDIEKFTVKREGKFIAHQFHFLLRQYSLTLIELRRVLLEREDLLRRIEEFNELLAKGEKKAFISQEHGQKEVYVDLQLKQYQCSLDSIELDLVNKFCSCEQYELHRKKLIELNNNIIPTNEQFQDEEPEYWKWYLVKKALHQYKDRMTGINVGVWENVQFLEEPANLREDYQVPVLGLNGNIDLQSVEKMLNEYMNEDKLLINSKKEIE